MNSDMTKISARLQEPFEPEDLEWRVQRCGVSRNKPWVAVVAYVTNRAIQQRLDDVLGFDGWQNEYSPSPSGSGFLCGLSVKTGDSWITKWDGAEGTNIESLKGGLSGSMKRAAVQFGIGRYLYNLETKFAVCNIVENRRDSQNNYAKHKEKNGNTTYHIDWANPELPSWALPNVDAEEYLNDLKKCKSLCELKGVFTDAYLFAKNFGRVDLQDKFKEQYEKSKGELDVLAQQNIENALKTLSDHIDKQLKALSMIPEKSSVSRVCKTIVSHINTASEGQYYDTTELISRVKQAESFRLNEIEAQQKEAA